MRLNALVLFSILALCIGHTARAQERIAVVVPATLDASAPIAEGVRQQCAVESNMGSQIFQRVSVRYPGSEQVQDANDAQDRIVLKTTILSVLGAGGGAWSGSKSITIRADVLQKAKVIGTTTLSRQSGGGVLGGVSGTCPIMHRIAVALGRDVAAWLPAALMVAKLNVPSSDVPAAPVPKE